MPDEYYKILGVPPDANIEQIKKAFREKARQYHPDLNTSCDTHEQFLKISEAYHYLTSLGKKGKTPEITIDQRKNEAKERARAYARMRYEEFVKQNELFEKTSVHEIYWGKTVTIILTLLALFFVLDTYLPVQSKTEPVLNYKKFCNSSEHCSGIINTANFTLGADKTFSYIWQGEALQIYYSALLRDVRYYTLANNSSISFHPPYHTAQYGIFAIIIFISGILVLFYPFKNFSQRLIVKTIMLFTVFIYSLIQLLFRIS